MAQPCKVFSYTNVGTEKGVLANIAGAAQAGGWTVDKNAVDAEGELYLHSTGGGNRRLYFSLRLVQAHDNAERFLLAVHGNEVETMKVEPRPKRGPEPPQQKSPRR